MTQEIKPEQKADSDSKGFKSEPHFGDSRCTGCEENLTLHRGCKHTNTNFEILGPRRTRLN
jgi:hypothetical protein